MDKISVIIPTYNREHTILNSVKSVLNQTYQNFEIIVVDDGSSDNTIDLLKKLNSDKIKVIVNETNKGAPYSRNRGIDLATGEYIAFQDSDDIWFENKLEVCLKAIKEHDADFVFHQVICDNVKGQPISPTTNFNLINDKMLYVLTKGGVNTQTMFAKAECFKNIKFDEKMPRSQDWEIMIRMTEKYKIYFIQQPLVHYIMLEDSISKSSKKGFIALERIYKKHFTRYYEKYGAELDYSYYYHKGELYALENDLKHASHYYSKALKIKFDKLLFAKIILMKFHLYKLFRKLVRG